MQRKCVIAVCVVVLGISASLLSGCKPSSLVSKSQEIEIGRQASQQVEQEYKVVNDPALNATVNDIGQTLAKCSDRPDLKYTFKVLDVKDVNAFSLPGGWVYIDYGLVKATTGRPDELAGVIAHEIGHIAARHHAEMIGRETYASILLGTLTKGDMQQIAGLFANLQLLHYSREQEYEADKLGIREMWRCRHTDPKLFDAQGLINFFDELLKQQPNKPSHLEQMFRTHPVTQNRITRAQQYLADLKAGKVDP